MSGGVISIPGAGFFTRGLETAVRFGFSPRQARSYLNAMVIAAVCLSIASGYTTWEGLRHYLPGIVALLVMFGVQLLLFVVSWEIGKTFPSTQVSPSKLGIYGTTMLVSVFFSFTSLLDYVYPSERREEDHRDATVVAARTAVFDIRSLAEIDFEEHRGSVRRTLAGWEGDVAQVAERYLADAEQQLALGKAAHQAARGKYDAEIQMGGTATASGGSSRGYGPLARSYLDESHRVQRDQVAPWRARVDKARTALREFRTAVVALKAPTLGAEADVALGNALASCSKLASVVTEAEVELPCALDSSVASSIHTLATGHRRWNQFDQDCDSARFVDPTNAMGRARSCIELAPVASRELLGEQLERLDDWDDWTSPKASYFEFSMGSLAHGHPLAVMALLIATMIDLLLLLCAFAGARPDSFLQRSLPKDLQEVFEECVDLSLGMNLVPVPGDGAVVIRIKQLLAEMEPSFAVSAQGFAGVIPAEALTRLEMQRELGILVGLGLVAPTPNGGVAIKTRLVLWMADRMRTETDVAEMSATLVPSASAEPTE